MSFNSLIYLLFVALMVPAYYATPQRYRWALLLSGSYYFYASWRVEYLLLLLTSTLVDYLAALRMDTLERRADRRPWLILSVSANLAILFFFKYFNFLGETLRSLLAPFHLFPAIPELGFLLPLGISFYTFQSMSYTIDVYRGNRRAERHLGIFALYVSFFPQLVAGPIETSTTLLPQFRERKRFKWNTFRLGMAFILLGYFKKLVIADRLALFVDHMYLNPEKYNGLQAFYTHLLGWYQYFADFSAYTDIAIGTAMLMGYKLMNNFDRPFAATSIRDFWRRWHISLIKWIGRYYLKPLVPYFRGPWLKLLLPVVIFFSVGLWHGANWTYVVWGTSFGVMMAISELWNDIRRRLRRGALPPGKKKPGALKKLTGIPFTLFLITLVGPYFRAPTIEEANHFFLKFFTVFPEEIAKLPEGWSRYELFIALFSITALEVGQWLNDRNPVWERYRSLPLVLRWAGGYASVLFVLAFAMFDVKQFIYFIF